MNITQAVSKLRTLLGNKAFYRLDPKAPDAEQRAEARLKCIEVRESLAEVKAQLERRREELLNGDSLYLQLDAKRIDLQKYRDDLRNKTLRYKVTIGTANSICFFVEAEGDSWNEVFEKLAEKKP